MYISHKSNVIQSVHETEWQCRRKSKGLNKSEYWTWLETIKDADGNPDYSGETGYTIVECIDEDIQTRLIQLSDYITTEMPGIPKAYNIKYYDSKRDSEIDGVKSHFIGDDEAKDARLLAEEWKRIREQRTRLLAETDWVVIKARENGGTVPAAWKTYRVALRDIPAEQSDKTKYSEITWPTRPE